MAEQTSGKSSKQDTETQSSMRAAKLSIRLSLFKYYIHDSTEALRFQLVGELNEQYVAELNGCWNTARNTLNQRKLVVDLRQLKGTDEIGRQWLLSMANEGAVYLPESYFRTELGGQNDSSKGSKNQVRPLSKLTSLFRSSRALPAESSTPTQ